MGHRATSIAAALFSLLVPNVAAAQQPPASEAVYVEAFGAALIYSVNYEHRFVERLGVRGGLSVLPLCIRRCKVVPIVPVALLTTIGSGDHHLELGLGLTAALNLDGDARFVVPQAGYRYERPSGGFVFRAMATPLFRARDPADVLPFGGWSAGYSW